MNKKVIGLDLDDVLGEFMKGFLKYIGNNLGGKYVEFDDIISFNLETIPGVNTTKEWLTQSFDNFILSDDIKKLETVYYSVDFLKLLKNQGYDIHVVTSRDGQKTGEATREWIDANYAGFITDVHFSSYRTQNNVSKSDILKKIGASTIIDDSPIFCRDIVAKFPECKIIMPNKPWNKYEIMENNIIRINCLSEIDINSL